MESQNYNTNIIAISFNSKAQKHMLLEAGELFAKC